MQSTKTQNHEYTIGEVLRRGVPIVQHEQTRREAEEKPDDPIDQLSYLYKKWLDCNGSREELLQAFGEFFNLTEAIVKHPAQHQRLLEHNTAHAMSAVMGGDLEIALMDIFSSWGLPPHHKDKKTLQVDALNRYNREANRIAKLHELSASVTVDDAERLVHHSAPTLVEYTTSAVAQSIVLTMEFINHQTLGELLENKTAAPQRGIKNVGDKIIYLAQTTLQGLEALKDSSDLDEQYALKGVILRAEALMVLWFACKKGKLKGAWPISASQRLHYGHFRHPENRINTDLICMFPSEDLAVPVRVHSANESLPGEAQKVAVIHRSDLYTFLLDKDCSMERQLGAITCGLMNIPGGATQEYLEMRATFLASKVNGLRSGIGASGKPWYSKTAELPRPVLKF